MWSSTSSSPKRSPSSVRARHSRLNMSAPWSARFFSSMPRKKLEHELAALEAALELETRDRQATTRHRRRHHVLEDAVHAPRLGTEIDADEDRRRDVERQRLVGGRRDRVPSPRPSLDAARRSSGSCARVLAQRRPLEGLVHDLAVVLVLVAVAQQQPVREDATHDRHPRLARREDLRRDRAAPAGSRRGRTGSPCAPAASPASPRCRSARACAGAATSMSTRPWFCSSVSSMSESVERGTSRSAPGAPSRTSRLEWSDAVIGCLRGGCSVPVARRLASSGIVNATRRRNAVIQSLPFGRSGHASTRLIFGAAALWRASQQEPTARSKSCSPPA